MKQSLFNKPNKDKGMKDQKIGEEKMKEEKTDKITRILFKNNGFAFRPQDWNRLKRIAEGNPDEDKEKYSR